MTEKNHETSVLREFGWKDSSSPFYHQYIYKPIEKLLPKDGSPILDIGCGNGSFANRLIDSGYCVYGVDISEDGIIIANQRNKGHFFVTALESAQLPEPLKNISFTTIISTEVIEHLFNPEAYVSTVYDILKNNLTNEVQKGTFILSTPYHGYIKNVFLAVCGKMDYHYSALWVGGHIKFWSKKTMSKLLTKAGFEDVKFRGAGRCAYLWRHMIIECVVNSVK